MPYQGPRNAGSAAGTTDVPSALDSLMAAEILLPAQVPSASNWSPEKRLAGAVLAAALAEVRLYHGRQSHRRQVEETLEWINADDLNWPFSFLRLCALFDLDASWVREVVWRWQQIEPELKRKRTIYRHAA